MRKSHLEQLGDADVQAQQVVPLYQSQAFQVQITGRHASDPAIRLNRQAVKALGCTITMSNQRDGSELHRQHDITYGFALP